MPTAKLKMYYENRYDRIVREGLTFHNTIQSKKQAVKRGKKAQRPGKNLLDALKGLKAAVLAFLKEPNVPFDNNQAERDVRMAKLKEKISGGYRSMAGAQFFCRIRGFVSTARKKKLPILQSIEQALLNKADRKSTRLNSSHIPLSRMPSSA